MALPTAFAELLARRWTPAAAGNGCGVRLVTPEDPEHAWCAVGRPLLLSARVSLLAAADDGGVSGSDACGGGAGVRDRLVPLLPLIFEKLLGKPLDSAPWNVPVISTASTAQEDGSLAVTVALQAAPLAAEGLFEVGTPLGLVALRLEGVQDAAVAAAPDGVSGDGDGSDGDEDLALVLALPTDWLEPSLLRRAWGAKAVEIGDGDEDGAGAWRAWLRQWGEIRRFQLSMHAGCEDEAEGSASFIATFEEAGSCRRCAAVLGGGRLLALRDPPRAAFVQARCAPRRGVDQAIHAAWAEHVRFEREISRIDSALVLEEATDAVPSGAEACFRPLLELLERWLGSLTLQATSTIYAQGRLQEEKAASRGKAPELFRRVCWHAAFSAVLRFRPPQGCAERLTLALAEHWRKAHGVCLEVDSEELSELSEVLQEVWLLASRAEDALRQSAEEEAKSAEQALIQELEDEEGRSVQVRKRREKKHQKERQRRRERAGAGTAAEAIPEAAPAPAGSGTGAVEIDAAEIAPPPEGARGDEARAAADARGAAVEASGEAEGARGEAACVAAESGAAAEESGGGAEVLHRAAARQFLRTVYRRCLPLASPKRSNRKRPSAVADPKPAQSPPVRREPDIHGILEAVRMSQELHHPPAVVAVAAVPRPPSDAGCTGRNSRACRAPPAVSPVRGCPEVSAEEGGAVAARAGQTPSEHQARRSATPVLAAVEDEGAVPAAGGVEEASAAAPRHFHMDMAKEAETRSETSSDVASEAACSQESPSKWSWDDSAESAGEPSAAEEPQSRRSVVTWSDLGDAAVLRRPAPRCLDTLPDSGAAHSCVATPRAAPVLLATAPSPASAVPAQAPPASPTSSPASPASAGTLLATVPAACAAGARSRPALQGAPPPDAAATRVVAASPQASPPASALMAHVPVPCAAGDCRQAVPQGAPGADAAVSEPAAPALASPSRAALLLATSPCAAAGFIGTPLQEAFAAGAEEAEAPHSASSPAAPSKSSRRSNRRRRRHGQGKEAASDASTAASGGQTSPCELSSAASEADSPCAGEAAAGHGAPGPRNVVTLSDLGLGLTLGTPGPRTDGAAPARAAAPPTVCGVSPGPQPAAAAAQVGGWPSQPFAYAEQCAGIMCTYPSSGPCPWSVAVAGEASQRTPTAAPAGSPTAGGESEVLRSLLHASGLCPSGGADLAAKLRALAPETYED